MVVPSSNSSTQRQGQKDPLRWRPGLGSITSEMKMFANNYLSINSFEKQFCLNYT